MRVRAAVRLVRARADRQRRRRAARSHGASADLERAQPEVAAEQRDGAVAAARARRSAPRARPARAGGPPRAASAGTLRRARAGLPGNVAVLDGDLQDARQRAHRLRGRCSALRAAVEQELLVRGEARHVERDAAARRGARSGDARAPTRTARASRARAWRRACGSRPRTNASSVIASRVSSRTRRGPSCARRLDLAVEACRRRPCGRTCASAAAVALAPLDLPLAVALVDAHRSDHGDDPQLGNGAAQRVFGVAAEVVRVSSSCTQSPKSSASSNVS